MKIGVLDNSGIHFTSKTFSLETKILKGEKF
jgi:hypothetical protein